MKIHAAFAGTAAIVLLLLLPAALVAQQVPLTGKMMGQSTVAAAAPATASAASAYAPAAPADVATTTVTPGFVARSHPPATAIGETTRSLLQMQADGSRAGKPLPMLGAEASASYDRYLKSFNHDIPEFYKTNVGKDSNGSGGVP